VKRCLLLCALLLLAAPCLAGGTAPEKLFFPCGRIAYLDQPTFNEPSGIVFHPGRGTLFLVGDAGDIGEMKTDGAGLRQAHLRDADFEGISVNPATGLLYVVIEGEEKILEVDPETFVVLRECALPRQLRGVTLLAPGGQGLEGITFVPDAKHPEGGTFFVANQGFLDSPKDDPSVILEVALPLKTGAGKELTATILRAIYPGVPDIGDLYYEAARQRLYLVSDTTNTFWEMNLKGELLRGYAFPGNDQEGITVDPQGFAYVAQDSGNFLKLKWRR
jgi:uncharacterized protein YjiK